MDQPPPHYLFREPGTQEGSSVYHDGSGYFYRVNTVNITSVCFICQKSTCLGRAVYHNEVGRLQLTQPHNHAPNANLHVVRAHRQNIMQRAEARDFIPFMTIIEEERRRIADRDVRSQLTYRRLRSGMQRATQHIFPPLPSTLYELSALFEDPQYRHLVETHDLRDCLYSGTVTAEDGSRHMIFVSERCLVVFRTVSCIFADGTFKITPSLIGIYQVFVIVTVSSHTVLPLCWCLMESKATCAYIAVLDHIRGRLGHWIFTTVVSDFEDAIILSFRFVFGIAVQGCYFHYVTDIGKWARSNLSHHVLQTFPLIKEMVHICSALPLLPQNLVQRGFNLIVAWALVTLSPILYDRAHPFLSYIQQQWLDHPNRGPALLVCGSSHRTDNASESNNWRMRRRMSDHPNIFVFVRRLADIEDSVVDDLAALSRGSIPTRHRAASAVSNDHTIQALTATLLENAIPTDGAIMMFLQQASFSVYNAAYEAMGFENMNNEAHNQ